VAADYRLWIPDPAAMYRANVDGTRELLRMAREAGVPRFVYTSSVATMHFRTDGLVINEDTPVSLKDMVGHYKRSKFWPSRRPSPPRSRPAGHHPQPHHPHRPQRRQAHAHGPHLCRLPQRQISRLRGHRPQSRGRRRSRPHPRRPRSPGAAGRRYILGGENLTLKQILDKMSAITGIPRPRSKFPSPSPPPTPFLRSGSPAASAASEPRATLEEVRMGRKKMYASSARAQQELGFRIVPDRLPRHARRHRSSWFRANGYAMKACPGREDWNSRFCDFRWMGGSSDPGPGDRSRL
jgi:dihydroflavonol-4-reductase